MFRNRFVSLALVGLFLFVTGCSSWTPIGISEVTDHGEVRVTRSAGDRWTIYDPRVEADSIKGKNLLAVPLDQVTKLEAEKTDTGATVALVMGLLVVAGGVTLAILAASDWTPYHN